MEKLSSFSYRQALVKISFILCMCSFRKTRHLSCLYACFMRQMDIGHGITLHIAY